MDFSFYGFRDVFSKIQSNICIIIGHCTIHDYIGMHA